MWAYINSCLPADQALRANRWQGVLDQRAWLRQRGIQPHYIATGWANAEAQAINAPVIRCNQLSFADARREQFRLLANCSDEWGLILDDDAILDHRSPVDIFKHLHRINEPHLFCARSQHINALPRIWEIRDKPEFRSELIFTRTTQFKGSFLIAKNIWTANNPLQVPEIPHGEDAAIMFEYFRSGYSAMMCQNILLKELGTQGTWVGGRDRNAWKYHVAQQFDGIEINNGTLNCRAFWKKHNAQPKITYPTNSNELFEF
jgi:hypothetical protein